MKTAIGALLVIVALAAGPFKTTTAPQTFTGTISDDMCARADHSQMRMGSTDAECTTACVSAHSAEYVLYDGKNVYTLSGGPAPEKFAGQKVRVTGTVDAKSRTIHVDTITLAR